MLAYLKIINIIWIYCLKELNYWKFFLVCFIITKFIEIFINIKL
jgi:hypothetical protein